MDTPDLTRRQRSRRRWLLGTIGVAGALVIGWSLAPPRQRLYASLPDGLAEGTVPLNGWVMLSADGLVTLMLAKSEMGQGVMTSLAMLVAEELDVPLSAVDLRQAPLQKIYGDVTLAPDGLPFRPDDDSALARGSRWMTHKLMRELGLLVTGSSSSVKDSWWPLRSAGAAARARLLAAAAQHWRALPADCRTEQGRVLHADGRTLGYGDLAQQAGAIGAVPYTLKSVRDFRLIGRAAPRLDAPPKSNGSACFGLDIRLPGLLYATAVMCPRVGGRLKSFNPDSLAGLAGVVQLIPLQADRSGAPDAVAIVATSRWTTLQALEKLQVEWGESLDGAQAQVSTADVIETLQRATLQNDGFTFYRRGDPAYRHGTRNVIADYSAPYLAHAAIEPQNCTAQLKDGQLTLWVPTQAPSTAVTAAARAGGVAPSAVELHVTQLGGGFGRRLDSDVVAQAAAIARKLGGRPVQLMWTREQDMRHDFYRPAAAARLAAQLDADGNVLVFTSQSASGAPAQQLMHRALGVPQIGPDKTTVEGLFDHPYDIPNQRIAHTVVDSPLPLGPWRSVGHSHNAFFIESFIDELALAAKTDPIEFRRRLLVNRPRHRAVLEAAVSLAGSAPAGHALGVALHESFGSIVAQLAEVSIDDRRIRVHRISCAVDCGIAVHPDGVRQQVESAICMGLSAALHERITIEGGQVQQSNYLDYRILQGWQMPEIAVTIVPSEAPPTGMGEPATPPVAPAVANAVFRLTGQRLRSLPLTLAG